MNTALIFIKINKQRVI